MDKIYTPPAEHLLFNAMAINHLTLDAAAKEQK